MKSLYLHCAYIFCLLVTMVEVSHAQQSILDVGFRFQKSINLYYENGITVQYSSRQLCPDKLYVGFSYVSSRFGSAFRSNAIKQDNLLVSAAWYFRKDRSLRPFSRLNVGYFIADYEYDIFDPIQNTAPLLSPEFGLAYQVKTLPVKLSASFGYNVITGDGLSGAGTVYPLYIQSGITVAIFEMLRK